MIKLIPVILFFVGIIFTNAQDRHTSMSLGFNIGGIQVQEYALNSLVHKGSLIVTRLSLVNESQSGLSHRVEFSFGIGSLKSRFKDKNSTYSNPQFRYSLTRPISYSIAVGGYLSGDYQVMEFENWDDSHIYWVTSYQIGPVLNIDDILFKGLFANFSFPILAVVSRSRNEIKNKVDSGEFLDILNLIHSNAAIISFVKHQVFDIHLRYAVINSKKINLSVRSSLKYVHSAISDIKEFTYASIVLGVLFTYKFN